MQCKHVKNYFSENINLILFFHFYFLNQDFYFTIIPPTLLLCDRIGNILLEGTVSQNFNLGPSFYFMPKNEKLFTIFCNIIF